MPIIKLPTGILKISGSAIKVPEPIPEGLGYGLLYNWYTVEGNASNLITDLHVPSDTEWTTLETYLGGSSVAGGKLKQTGTLEAGTGLWYDPNTGATDEVNFTALPGSTRDSNDGAFYDDGTDAWFWTTTEGRFERAFYYNINYSDSFLFVTDINYRFGCSVRCLRTLTAQEQIDFADGDVVETKTDYDGNSYDVVRIGTQGWSVGSLKTTHYLDGTALTKVTDNTTWSNAGTGDAYYCAYDNDEGNV
jgi:uncharacterized protein (TIGR02145 family)